MQNSNSKFLWYATPDGENVAEVYNLKCLYSPEKGDHGYGEIIAGRYYKCYVRNDASWRDHYYIPLLNKAVAAVRNCFEPLPEKNPCVLTGLLDAIKTIYRNEFPAICHISEETAKKIHELNVRNGKTMTIEEIVGSYKEIGKLIENDAARDYFIPDNVIKKDFKDLSDIIHDLKAAKLSYKSVSIDAYKYNQHSIELNNEMS